MSDYKKRIGDYGENIASQYLKNINHIILKNNFRTSKGEIDIISRLYDTVVFTEVKTRYNSLYGRASEAVTLHKQHIIKQIASYYIYKHRLYSLNARFDVIEIYLNYHDNSYKINHIKNAF